VLNRLEFSPSDRSVRRATYGSGTEETSVTVNFGETDAEAETLHGGRVVLPRWGFVVEAPGFVAFCAKRWDGRDYPEGALFTVRAADPGTAFAASRRVRVFHGFGDPVLSWHGVRHEVAREATMPSPSHQ